MLGTVSIWVFNFWLCQVLCSGHSLVVSGANYSSGVRASNLEKQALGHKGSVVANRLSFSGMGDLHQGSYLRVPPPPITRRVLNHRTTREAKSIWFLNLEKGS